MHPMAMAEAYLAPWAAWQQQLFMCTNQGAKVSEHRVAFGCVLLLTKRKCECNLRVR
jgi:hypothetical protein